ncbi:MAG: type I DNA topoisomerase [Planctomycetaceae bacterium]|nr:type I DNA topoisomerase [Planctomycetales bacterium]MCB9925733.1 type I DNA topoisomerase [Planctomycetaceae bacterium]
MAKKASSTGGKSLVIVESPAKARTIGKFLGKDFTVEASIGHIRDLPQGSKEVPEEFKKESWSYLGVNVEDRFTPIYIVPAGKKQQVAKLRSALKAAKDLYLATDEDREGEAISWHLHEVLKPKVPVKRLVFHEITKEAIQEAIDNPREIDDGLVRAQEARRILDRLYGYDVSQLLWKKVGRGLSAGRVQSVSVRLIVERERQRMAFRSATYWDLLGTFAAEASDEFQATLISVDGRKIPSGKDFDSSTGKIKDETLLMLDEAAAKELNDRLRFAKFKVLSVESKPYTRKPAPPFTTSTMQQEANRKLGFTARRTMNAAQSLYENGHITYMRTDSTNLAQVAVDAARDLVRSEYGSDYLPETPRAYANKVKNAQEAHEAIRPAGHPFELPGALKGNLNSDEYRLFEMIWKRTIASQMVDARGHNTTVMIEGDGAIFRVSGRTIDFPGFLRAYVEGSDNPNAELADRETILPAVEEGQPVECRDLHSTDHTTQPPSRFTEASLTRELEDKGIGRPSTYASIIDTIQARDYVFKKGNALVPTWTAFAVTRLLEEHFGSLVDYQFTAQMEDLLDSISRREAESVDYLQNFYFGDQPGLKAKLAAKTEEIDPRVMSRFPVGTPTEGEHREEIVLRVGKFGPFVEQGERKASLPEGMAPDELTLERAVELLDQGARDDEPLGICPDTHKPVFLKVGRFGPYVQRGTPEDDEKPKNASLLKGMTPEDITFEVALRLLTLPRTLGEHPELKAPVIAQNGRFGPYISCGKETRSLPADLSPIDVTFEQAVELLAKPKTRGRGAAKEPLKVFEASPVTEEPIKLLEGRYGPYVTDGETNASLPKGISPDELTFDQAVNLLAERAAKGGTKKKKKTAKKAAKNAPKKKAAKKKVAKKKTE